MDAIAHLYNCDWDKVWKMSVVQFFNLLSYRNDKAAEEKRIAEQYRRS